MYISTFWAVDTNIEQKMSVAELRMLRWVSRVTSCVIIMNNELVYKRKYSIVSIVNKTRKNRLIEIMA